MRCFKERLSRSSFQTTNVSRAHTRWLRPDSSLPAFWRGSSCKWSAVETHAQPIRMPNPSTAQTASLRANFAPRSVSLPPCPQGCLCTIGGSVPRALGWCRFGQPARRVLTASASAIHPATRGGLRPIQLPQTRTLASEKHVSAVQSPGAGLTNPVSEAGLACFVPMSFSTM